LNRLIKWEPKKELIVVFISLLWMWFAYYGNTHIYGNNELLQFFIWVVITVIIVNVCFPAWWIIRRQREGFEALGKTKTK
jgi:O-antigen/teichoic acid export membrane protein